MFSESIPWMGLTVEVQHITNIEQPQRIILKDEDGNSYKMSAATVEHLMHLFRIALIWKKNDEDTFVNQLNDLPHQIIMQEYLPLFGNRNRVLYRLEGDRYWFDKVLEGEQTHHVTNMTLGELKALVARDTELREASYASGLSDEWNTGTIKLITDPILVTEMLESYKKES